MRQHQTNHVFVASVVLGVGVLVVGSTEARAQAWVGDRGGLDVGLDYNLGISDTVVGKEDENGDAGTTSHQMTLGVEYAPIRNLAVNVSVPFGGYKYTGDPIKYPHDPMLATFDDGELHWTLVDLRAGARYQLLDDPVALAPHLAFSVPIADYPTIGNTTPGRHLKMLHAGLGVGTVLGTATYIHALYEFTLAEKYKAGTDGQVEDHGQNRSDFGLTIGHKLLDYRLDIHVDLNGRLTHGGVGIDLTEFIEMSPDERKYHDAILDEDVFMAGAGVGYQITNSFSVSAGARFFLTGQNTQKSTLFALGVQWSPCLTNCPEDADAAAVMDAEAAVGAE